MTFDKIIEDHKKYKNFIFDEKKYENMFGEYYFKFFESHPLLEGIDNTHPIYMFLMENALKNNKKINDNDIEEAKKIFNIRQDVEY